MFPFVLQLNLWGPTVEVGPYTLFFFLAAATVLVGGLWLAKRRGFNVRQVGWVMAAMLLAALVGARGLNALVNLQSYLAEPARFWEVSVSGFSLYGGVLAALAAGYAVCRVLKIDAFRLGDTLVPFLGIGVALMRVGCFLRGCCFGVETDLPWGVRFPMLSPAHLHQMAEHGNFLEVIAVHPTQLYEMFFALLLTGLAFRGLSRKWPTGVVMVMFLTYFSLFRLVNYFLRVNPEGFSAPAYFYPVIYLLLFVTGVIILRRINIMKAKTANE